MTKHNKQTSKYNNNDNNKHSDKNIVEISWEECWRPEEIGFHSDSMKDHQLMQLWKTHKEYNNNNNNNNNNNTRQQNLAMGWIDNKMICFPKAG